MHNRIAAAVASLAFVAACQSSPHQETQRLESALQQSTVLSNEILSWRSQMTQTIPSSVVETVKSFKMRASELSEEIGEISEEVAEDGQVPAVQQALQTLADFNTERFDTTSPAGRSTLMDQFCGAATAVKTAAERAQRG